MNPDTSAAGCNTSPNTFISANDSIRRWPARQWRWDLTWPVRGRLAPLMLLGILPFFLLGCLVVYCWARHHLGNAAAVIAAGLFVMIPPVLADAGLATTDMALAACLGAAFFSLVLWAESPTWKRSLLMGVSAARAALSKFTALPFLPAAAILALLSHPAVQWPGWRKLAALLRKRAIMFVPAVVTGALLVWAAYWFSFGKVPQWNVSLPAPECFDGVSAATAHNEQGHPAYLLGKVSVTGWWYYFPVVLAVKTPIGLRHILPVYIGFSILAALAVVQMAQWARTRTWALTLAGLCVVWMAVSGAIRHPDYLAYFNEFVPSEPDRVLVDANLDWRQDLKLLARHLWELWSTRLRPSASPVTSRRGTACRPSSRSIRTTPHPAGIS